MFWEQHWSRFVLADGLHINPAQVTYAQFGQAVLLLNTLASGCFRGLSEKKRLVARGFERECFRSCSGHGPGWSVKRCSKSSSLHSKKFFLLGGCFFCEWRHKWRTFRPPWPTLPGPGRQPLGGSISLKFFTGNWATVRVFWYFGWPAGVWGSKVMM